MGAVVDSDRAVLDDAACDAVVHGFGFVNRLDGPASSSVCGSSSSSAALVWVCSSSDSESSPLIGRSFEAMVGQEEARRRSVPWAAMGQPMTPNAAVESVMMMVAE